MEEYRDKLMSALESVWAEVQGRISVGDYSTAVCEMVTGIDGYLYDKNYISRLRMSYYLLLSENKPKNTEEIVRRLMEEEIISREKDEFRGIGEGLEILTVLLDGYNGDGKYDRVFERAKNANSDCVLGYSPESYRKGYPSDISLYSREKCGDIADILELNGLYGKEEVK